MILIKFLKSNAIINKQDVERLTLLSAGEYMAKT